MTTKQNENTMSATDVGHIDNRLVTVEKEIVGVKADVSYIRSSIDAISATQTTAAAAARTNWGMLASWAAVILSLGIYHGGMTLRPLEQAIQQGVAEDEDIPQQYDKGLLYVILLAGRAVQHARKHSSGSSSSPWRVSSRLAGAVAAAASRFRCAIR